MKKALKILGVILGIFLLLCIIIVVLARYVFRDEVIAFLNVELLSYTDGPHVFKDSNDKLKILTIDSAEVSINTYLSQIDTALLLDVNDIFSVNLRKEQIISSDIDFKDIEKIFCIGDIHGEFEGFAKLLINNNIIDTNYNWTFDNNHVVICGDVFDRGSLVTECLWLIYKLEEEAIKKGGRLHYLLGNHEVMVLIGDLRYLHKKYKSIQAKVGISYSYLFSQNSILGKWLRTKPVAITINEMLFLHGGIHPDIIMEKISLDEINFHVKQYINYDDFSPITSLLIGNKGPLWYRGYIEPGYGYEKITSKEVDNTLSHFNVNKIIFGHTVVESVTNLFNNKLVAIDVPLTKEYAEALLIEDNKFYIVTNAGVN